MHRRDLAVAVLLMLLGGAVVEESLRMPRYENLGVNPYTAPGIVPAVLGGAILVFALVLLVRSFRTGAPRRAPATPTVPPSDRSDRASEGGNGPQGAAAHAAAAVAPTDRTEPAAPPTADDASGDARASVRRLGLTLALTLTYAAVLVGRLPFWLATFLFVFAFIAIFEWRGDRPPLRHARRLGTAALEAGLVAAAVTYVFERIFLVRLP